MGIENRRKVGSDWFIIKKNTKSDKSLDFYTNQFCPSDFFIYKATGRFKEVSVEDFLDFRYAQYIFLKKELYDKNWIDCWIKWFDKIRFRILFLPKPFPPFNPEKIKIKDEISKRIENYKLYESILKNK